VKENHKEVTQDQEQGYLQKDLKLEVKLKLQIDL
jgi:hypothetical protein